jgi:hypothetical protein
MHIIEGKSGKSRHIDYIVRNELKGHKVAIVDAVGVKNLMILDAEYFLLGSNYSLVQILDVIKELEKYDNFDYIILELNLPKSEFDLAAIKNIENATEAEIILTVQNDLINGWTEYHI